jgi:hypothetical protein
MDIDLTGFSVFQQQALCDLLILSMFADGHLTTAKDEHLQGLLTSLGHAAESERQGEFEAAVNRMRPFAQSIWKAKTEAVLLAGAFTNRLQQKLVYAAVQDIMTADRHVSTWECTLLSELRMKFRL